MSYIYSQVVLAPVAAGAWLNMSFPGVMRRLSPFAPLLAASMTILVSSSIIAQNAAALKSAGWQLFLAVITLHLGELIMVRRACRCCAVVLAPHAWP